MALKDYIIAVALVLAGIYFTYQTWSKAYAQGTIPGVYFCGPFLIVAELFDIFRANRGIRFGFVNVSLALVAGVALSVVNFHLITTEYPQVHFN